VLGGTPEAVQHALLIRQWSPDVTLFPHTDAVGSEQREHLSARGIGIVEGTVARLVVDNDRLHGVELVGGFVVPRTAVFVHPRFVPNTELLIGLGRAVDEHGWVVPDQAGRTSVAGVWVAGNAADPRAQVISAAGEGSAAAIALNADLVDEDLQRALADHRAGHSLRASASHSIDLSSTLSIKVLTSPEPSSSSQLPTVPGGSVGPFELTHVP
jgi:thioredoxin reductase